MQLFIIYLSVLLSLQGSIYLPHGSFLPKHELDPSYENSTEASITALSSLLLHKPNKIVDEARFSKYQHVLSETTNTDEAQKCGQAFHSIQNWWYYAFQSGRNATQYATNIIDKLTNSTGEAARELSDFKETIEHIVNVTSTFREEFSSGHLTLSGISNKLGEQLQVIFEEIKEEFGDTKPNVPAEEREKERETMVDKILEKVESVFVKVLKEVNLKEEIARARFDQIKPKIKQFLQIAGRLADKHPVVVETLLVSATFFIIPEAWLLRPILSLFGFGPYGPVRGSLAAWAQRRFWGAAVTKGSWFSHLQRAGMKLPSSWFLSATVSATVAFGVAGSVCSCMERWFRRGA